MLVRCWQPPFSPTAWPPLCLLLLTCSIILATAVVRADGYDDIVQAAEPPPPDHANVTFAQSGIDLGAPLAPYAAEWRQLILDMFVSFGDSYAVMSHSFFSWFRGQQRSNALVIVSDCGVLGEVPQLCRHLWRLATELWLGLRGILTDIEVLLEGFMRHLANSLQASLPARLRSDVRVVGLCEETRRAVQAADDGYEENYRRSRANYMRTVRRQVNGMEELHRQALAVRDYQVGWRLMQRRFEEFVAAQNALLVEVMAEYWSHSMVVYHRDWNRYCGAFVDVLREMY